MQIIICNISGQRSAALDLKNKTFEQVKAETREAIQSPSK